MSGCMSRMRQLDDINIAIASGSEAVQQLLQRNLQQRGAKISCCGSLDLSFVICLESEAKADVILLDINDNNGYSYDEDVLELLLERIEVSVLFHDYDFIVNRHGNDNAHISEGVWLLEHQLEQLAEKISALVSSNSEGSLRAEGSLQTKDSRISAEPIIDIEDPSFQQKKKTSRQTDKLEYTSYDKDLESISQALVKATPTLADNLQSEKYIGETDKIKLSKMYSSKPSSGINDEVALELNVWILGASIGGPESVKRFLTTLPADLPVAFVLAQHLGEGFEKLLAQQLDSVSQFSVKKATNGDCLKQGEVLVVPVKNRITFDKKGVVSVLEEQWQGHYKPSIDEVISDITLNFNQHTGVIILSGMGADGVEASMQFHKQYQGIVWAQEAGSCIVSSMPDSVRKANIVSYSGSPESLANKLVAHYSG